MNDPAVSHVVRFHNQARFAAEAVQSVLAQDYAPMEIIFSDDCSSDDTLAVIEAECARYAGPNTVRVNRTGDNLGDVGHINRLVEIASGDFIVFSDGDDIALPGKTRHLVEAWQELGVSLVASNGLKVDAEGHDLDQPLRLEGEKDCSFARICERIACATSSSGAFGFERRIFDVFGPVPTHLEVGDRLIPFRAGLLGGNHFLDQPLIKYRIHGANDSMVLKLDVLIRNGDLFAARGLAERQTYNNTAHALVMFDEIIDYIGRFGSTTELEARKVDIIKCIVTVSQQWVDARRRLIEDYAGHSQSIA